LSRRRIIIFENISEPNPGSKIFETGAESENVTPATSGIHTGIKTTSEFQMFSFFPSYSRAQGIKSTAAPRKLSRKFVRFSAVQPSIGRAATTTSQTLANV